jgi:lysophospholipase L1-like esterase
VRRFWLCLFTVACSGVADPGWATRNITAWGDSLTDGQPFTRAESYPTQLAALMPDRVVTNEGVGGETSSQVVARMLADTAHRHDVTLLWMGRNNLGNPDQILRDIATAVKSLGTNRFLILAVLNGDFGGTEAKGSPGYDNIVALNAALAVRYPGNYLDIRSYLVSQYDASNSQDVVDHAHDIPPTSLRAHLNGGVDAVHLGPAGNALVARRVAGFITGRGW